MNEESKYYLTLSFKDAALIVKNNYLYTGKNPPKYARSSKYITSMADYEEPDLDHPIGIEQLANALHVMCGIPPVPSKRKDECIFSFNDKLVKMAKNSYIRYDNFPYCRIKGKLFKTPDGRWCKTDKDYTYFGQMFQGNKAHYNSNRRGATKIDDVSYTGIYNWEIFHSYFFKAEDKWKQLIDFFNDILGVDDVIRQYTYIDFVKEFHKHMNNENVVDFIKNEYQEIKKLKIIDNIHKCDKYTLGCVNHLKIIFNEGNGGTDITTQGHYPLYNLNDINFLKIKYRGEIIIPVYDERVVEQMGTVGITPNILDGGIVTVIGLQKSIPSSILNDNFCKISEQNMLKTFENQ